MVEPTEAAAVHQLAAGDRVWDIRAGAWVVLEDVSSTWDRDDQQSLAMTHRVVLTVAGRPGSPLRAEQKVVRGRLTDPL